MRRPHRERGLADPAGSVHDHHGRPAGRLQRRAHRVEFGGTLDERRIVQRQLTGWHEHRTRRGRRRGQQRLVPVEDRAVQPGQLGGWFDADPFGKDRPGPLKRRQCTGGVAAAVLRDHQQLPQPLPQRVGHDLPPQLGDDLGVASLCQAGRGERLDRVAPLLVEGVEQAAEGGVAPYTRSRRTSPVRERRAEPLGRGVDRPLLLQHPAGTELPVERVQVELPVVDLDEEPRAAGDEPGPAGMVRIGEDPPQPHTVGADVGLRGQRRVFLPQQVGDPVQRQHLVGVQQQHQQQHALLRRAERHRSPVAPDLDGPEDPELEVTHAPTSAAVERPIYGHHAGNSTPPSGQGPRAAHRRQPGPLILIR